MLNQRLVAKRVLRDQKLLKQLAVVPAVFFFYPPHQLPAKELLKLYVLFSRRGFGWSLFSRRGHPSFVPRGHAAYRFLASGNLYGLYGPTIALWQEAAALFPVLAEPSFGLSQGHFFLQPQAFLLASSQAPSLLCGNLQASGYPLVEALSLLAVQLTILLKP